MSKVNFLWKLNWWLWRVWDALQDCCSFVCDYIFFFFLPVYQTEISCWMKVRHVFLKEKLNGKLYCHLQNCMTHAVFVEKKHFKTQFTSRFSLTFGLPLSFTTSLSLFTSLSHFLSRSCPCLSISLSVGLSSHSNFPYISFPSRAWEQGGQWGELRGQQWWGGGRADSPERCSALLSAGQQPSQVATPQVLGHCLIHWGN